MFLVTGASGFIGRAFCERLKASGAALRPVVRRRPMGDQEVIGDIHGKSDWHKALEGVDVIVHLAGHAHMPVRSAADERAIESVNVEGTRHLARSAVRSGVNRFVFVSSIKVCGEETGCDPFPSDFSHLSPANPQDAYAWSKWSAEQAVIEEAVRGQMEFVIVRPPLVYGPGVKANFLRLVSAVRVGIPLPFASIENSRSLISLENLCTLLFECGRHPKAANEVFMASDGNDVSTPELVRRIAEVVGRPARVFPLPPAVLEAAGRLAGRPTAVFRLTRSLRADISHTVDSLGWRPDQSLEEGLRSTIAALDDH